MRKELPDDAVQTVDAIMRQLCGYSVSEAEMILKAVAMQIRECAVIEEAK